MGGSLAWLDPIVQACRGIIACSTQDYITGRLQLEKYFNVVWPGNVFTILDFGINFPNGWHFRIAIKIVK